MQSPVVDGNVAIVVIDVEVVDVLFVSARIADVTDIVVLVNVEDWFIP